MISQQPRREQFAATPVNLDFFRDAVQGLGAPVPSIPCKWLYDARGSALFEEICRTADYYVTRTEMKVLHANAEYWASLMGPDVELVEPGAGAGEKASLLLRKMRSPAAYLPLDISESATQSAVRNVRLHHPELLVEARVGDFTARGASIPRVTSSRRRLLFFPGSTLGNFDPVQRRSVLETFRGWLRGGDLLLIGVDLIKDTRVLERAYDDRQGVTAAFNLNLLERLRRETNAEVYPRQFRHRAVYDAELRRVEMHLVSTTHQSIRLGAHRFDFEEGDYIHTENSHKFDAGQFSREVETCGFSLLDRREDDQIHFSEQLFEAL